MSCFALLSTALGILSSLMLRDVSALRLPPPDDSDADTLTWQRFPEDAQEIPRSLEIEDFTLNVAPTSGRVNSPTIIRLHPITAKPAHLHINLPLRFGRNPSTGTPDRAPKTINLPQRFGRSGTGPSANLPQRFGRRNVFAAEALRSLSLHPRTSPSWFLKDRTQVSENMSEMTEDSEEKSTEYTTL